MKRQGDEYSTLRKEILVVVLLVSVEVLVVRSSSKSTVTDSCTACQARRVQTRHEALTSVNPTLEAQTDLQLAKASALEDTQHHSNWNRGERQVVVVPLAPAIDLLHIHQHCLAGRWYGRCLT